MRPTSATDCTCIAIETLPALGPVYIANDFYFPVASDEVRRVLLSFNDELTFREWAMEDGL